MQQSVVTVSQAAKVLTESGIFSLLAFGANSYAIVDTTSQLQTRMTTEQVVAFAQVQAVDLGLSA